MDCSLPDFSVHEIFQARILERIAISFSRWSSQPKDPICSNPCLLCLLHWQADSLPLAPLSFLKFNQHWSLSWWLAFLSSWYFIPKKKRHYFADKGPSNKSYRFSRSHVWMWEFDYKETWARKILCFWTTVLKKILESHLCKEIKPVNPKVNQSWIFTRRTYWSWNPNTLATWSKELTH